VTTYKADLKTNFYYIIGVVVFLGVTIPLSTTFSIYSWILLITLLVLLLSYNLFTSRLNKIHLDNDNRKLTLIYRNYFGARKSIVHDLSNIKFTYKRQATSFRGGVKNVYSIYNFDKRIEQLIPDQDGWDDSEIFSFVHGLINAGIEKKFIGYTLKDAKI
jgi:Ca2+/Na+ antiporter